VAGIFIHYVESNGSPTGKLIYFILFLFDLRYLHNQDRQLLHYG
jgi:hypothetical protein